jgi:hypothetical protein
VVLLVDAVDEANKADKASYEVDKANHACKAIVAYEAHEANETVKANEVDKTNEADKASKYCEARVTNRAEANKAIVFVKSPLLLPFSLTKYTAIFAEVTGSFGIHYNEFGGLKRGCLSTCSLMIQFLYIRSILKNIWRKYCSLGSQCNNQLEQVISNGGWSNLLDWLL